MIHLYRSICSTYSIRGHQMIRDHPHELNENDNKMALNWYKWCWWQLHSQNRSDRTDMKTENKKEIGFDAIEFYLYCLLFFRSSVSMAKMINLFVVFLEIKPYLIFDSKNFHSSDDRKLCVNHLWSQKETIIIMYVMSLRLVNLI